MKIKARNKLIPALAMLIIAAVSLTSASYAWFTMSRTVTATGISLTAIAPTNLLISNAESGTYSETTVVNETYTGHIIPVSSWNGLEFWSAENVSVDNDGAPSSSTHFTKVTSGALSGSSDGYYADFKLWLATTGEDDVPVTVSTLLSAIGDGSYTKLADNGSTIPADATHYATAAAPTTILALEGGHVYSATETYYKIQSISGAARFAILDGDGTDLTTGGVNNIYATKNGVTTENYFQDILGVTTDDIVGPLKSTDYAAGIQPNFLGSAITVNDSNVLFTVAGMTPTQIANADAHGTGYPITVRVWIEGQDSDCVSENTNANFTMTVGFKDSAYTE